MPKMISKFVIPFLMLYLAFCIGLLYWVIIYSGSGDGDTLEHVHSSWLIYSGKHPYKDFFQHHNPLIWYMAAPLVGAFEYSLRAVDAVNALTATITVLNVIYIYRIHTHFLTNKLGGLLAASFFILPHESLYNKDFKPDNYMVFGLVVGIYYLFSYLKEKKLVNLVVSFLLFFAAFMFTQKAAVILIGIGGIVIYLLYKKEISWNDFLYSALLPLLIYGAYLAYLYRDGVLEMYFKANFELNAHIPDVFYTRRFIGPTLEMILPLLLALYALWCCFYNENLYIKLAGGIFILEYLIRMYYFTPFVYYYAFLLASASIFAGVGAVNLINRFSKAVWLFIIYFLGVGGYYLNYYHWRITLGDQYKYGASGYILSLTNPCDYVVNGYRIGYNLFGKDIDFIWNLLGQIDVIASTIGIRPTADLEALIRKHRPKIIFGGNYYDTYLEYRGAIGVFPIHQISEHILKEMYMPLHRDDLYILKPEYQSYDCRYNPRTKTYEYRDSH